MKYTFEEYLAFIENTLKIRIFDWQVYLLRNFYEEKESFFVPLRYKEREIAYKALELLEELMNKENQHETT